LFLEVAMPYSMDNPPSKIKGLPKHAKEIWIAAFNAALKEYDDEGKATATAWSAVKKAGYEQDEKGEWHKANAITELWDSIKRLFIPLIDDDPEERAIKDAASWSGAASNYDSTEAYCKACLINTNTGDPANWTQDNCKLPVKDPGGSYVKQGIHAAAVALAGGRTPLKAPPEEKAKAANKLISLYNQMDEIAPDSIYKAAGKEPPKRMIAYLPTQTRFTITRDAQGVPRWLMIAASAVVNKVGAIDSTILFDNFIRHAEESSEYPVLDFLHEGERVRFGVADWLRRDGALYLASGGFDDTELARGAIAGLEAQADYWGASIAYRVTQAPLMLVSEGEIPVYTDGVNNFISIVPKRLAANLFTAALVAEEVRRMDKRTYEELCKLVGEERAKQFEAQVDDANRTITDTGMVTRAEAAPDPEVAAPSVAPVAAPVVETRQEPPAPAEQKPDDLAALKAQVAELVARVTKLEESYGMGMEESKRTQQRATDAIADLASRLAGVEASKERWDTWLNDAPEYIKQDAEKIFRARNQEPAPMTLEQIAAQSTAKMNRGPHFSRQHS
jgi:cation transport regulator